MSAMTTEEVWYPRPPSPDDDECYDPTCACHRLDLKDRPAVPLERADKKDADQE